MKIYILNPPYLKSFSRPQRSPAVTKSGTLYYPIWLIYATGVLESEGMDVRLVDAPAAGLEVEDILLECRTFQPDIVVMDTSTPSIYNDIRVAENIKETLPNTFIIFVGTHVSALPEETLNLSKRIDVIARKEYDYTIRDIVRTIKNKGDMSEVKGISFIKNGRIFHTPDRPYIKDLDPIPFASRIIKKHLDYRRYFNPNALYPMVTILTGRGCNYRCVFCVYPQTLQGHDYRLRSVENVADEFEYIAGEFPDVKAVFIEDDTFTTDKSRCRELADTLIKRNIKLSWTANSRADVDYETLKRMKEAGLRCLCVGFESGHQEVLNQMKKGLRLERIYQFMEDAKRAGVLIHGCFMVGNPGETKATLNKTLDMAKKLNPDTAQFYPIMIYPGTEAYQWAKEKGYLTCTDYSKWLTEEGLHNCVISTPDVSSEELVRFCDNARREFYLRPRYVFSKLFQMIKSPAEGQRLMKSFRTFSKYLLKGSFTTK